MATSKGHGRKNWPDWLSVITYRYNLNHNAMIRESPFIVVFWREAYIILNEKTGVMDRHVDSELCRLVKEQCVTRRAAQFRDHMGSVANKLEPGEVV